MNFKSLSRPNLPRLPQRLRKFIGMILIVLLVFFYALLIAAMGASTWFPDNAFIEFMFYLIFGLGWCLPAGIIIWWMECPDTPPDIAPKTRK